MSKFKAGEVAILIDYDARHCKRYVGAECEILSVGYYVGKATGQRYKYHIKTNDGHDAVCNDNHLKKLPPKQELAKWSDCIWKPEGIEECVRES